MFLLSSDDKTFNCVLFVTFVALTLNSKCRSYIWCLTNSKCHPMSAEKYKGCLVSGYLHCFILGYIVRSRIKRNILLIIFIHTHTQTTYTLTHTHWHYLLALRHPSRYWICVLLCCLLHKRLLSITMHLLVTDVLKCYHSIFQSCSIL